MPPATALLLHGFASGPASMWRFQEWLAELGYQAEARAQLGHGGRGPAADYFWPPWRRTISRSAITTSSSATPWAAPRPRWPRPGGRGAGRLVLVDPAWRFPTADEAADAKREELAALDRDAGEIRAAYSAWDERDGEAKIQEVARVWRPAVEGIIDANLDADLRDAARSLAVPTLVICGDPAARQGPSPSPTATPWRPRTRTAPRADRRDRPQPAPRRPGSRPAGPPRLARSPALATQRGTAHRERSRACRSACHCAGVSRSRPRRPCPHPIRAQIHQPKSLRSHHSLPASLLRTQKATRTITTRTISHKNTKGLVPGGGLSRPRRTRAEGCPDAEPDVEMGTPRRRVT